MYILLLAIFLAVVLLSVVGNGDFLTFGLSLYACLILSSLVAPLE